MNLRKMYYFLPPAWRFFARKIFFLPIDLYDSLTGKRGKYQPPKGDIYIGSGDFVEQGRLQLSLLKKYISLAKNDAVLDVGCGIGRTAAALTQYLGKEAVYEGFDVVEKGVNWCNAKIKKDFPNFNFIYVPLENDLYNHAGQKASEFRFPYPAQSFDKVFLFSVFTHMQVAEIEHYLNEIARVIKPGGACLATFFLYDHSNEGSISGRSSFHFPIKKEGYRLMDERVKSANIAIDTVLLDKMLLKADLELKEKVDGFWKDETLKHGDNQFQDMVVLTPQPPTSGVSR